MARTELPVITLGDLIDQPTKSYPENAVMHFTRVEHPVQRKEGAATTGKEPG